MKQFKLPFDKRHEFHVEIVEQSRYVGYYENFAGLRIYVTSYGWAVPPSVWDGKKNCINAILENIRRPYVRMGDGTLWFFIQNEMVSEHGDINDLCMEISSKESLILDETGF